LVGRGYGNLKKLANNGGYDTIANKSGIIDAQFLGVV
jgi:hypothetical protein